MSITARLNHKGDIAARGDCTVTGHRIGLARPVDEVESISIVLTDWLDGATVTTRTIENATAEATEVSYGSDTWVMTLTGEGTAKIKLTLSDDRLWSGVLAMVET